MRHRVYLGEKGRVDGKHYRRSIRYINKISFTANNTLVRGVTMIQELGERRLYNEYEDRMPEPGDRVFVFDGDRILVRKEAEGLMVPFAKDFRGKKMQYLFRIDEDGYFLLKEPSEKICEDLETSGFFWESTRNLRDLAFKELAFAAATAYHLFQWYRDSRFCGRCGSPLSHSGKERMMYCQACGNTVYPKIAPAVIVGVINDDKLLITKYNGRVYKKYALIAGFTEIGETAEETVAREVMEEAGLKVKDITYYKSQPWGTDCNLLLGFFCRLDGEDKITMDSEELSVAEWVKREDFEVHDDGISLTREMMRVFKEGEIELCTTSL